MNQITFLRELLSRRRFCGGLAAGGGLLLSDSFSTRDLEHEEGEGEYAGEAEDMAAAERLFGLSFEPAQRQLAARRLQRQRRSWGQLRERELDWGTAPAFVFDPLPPGVKPPAVSPGPAALKFEDPIPISSDADLAYASVEQLAALLRAREVTSRRLTELCIARLEKHDPQLLCVVTLLKKEALAAADAADLEIAMGKWAGPLHGIPYGAKDLFAWPGAPTTFGATAYQEQVLSGKATVLARLEQAGAVLVAKLSMGALAMGDVWYGGTTKNPWNLAQGSSGSSAGPAAAVAAGLLPFALGTETCGSIVSPCARCGCTGLRPTFGLVSRHGAMPLSWTMDKVGPIARSAVDCALIFESIRGVDGKDQSLRRAAFPFRPKSKIEGLAIGYVGSPRAFESGPNPEFLDFLEKAGAKLEAVELPAFPYSALMSILHAEAATAFDDLTRSPDIHKLKRQDRGSWPNTFRSARFIPAVEYLRAARIRSQLIQAMHEFMAKYDAIVAPRTGSPMLYCSNLTGHPACVLPHGKRKNGTPTAITLVGRLFDESRILGIAEAWQRASLWHQGRPLP